MMQTTNPVNTEVRSIEKQDMLNEATRLQSEGYRLAQMCSTKVEDGYDMLYTFEKGYDLLHLRFNVAAGDKIESISHIFPAAFFYENEIHDLFGVPIEFMTIDYHGGLYRTAEKTPFH
jgi:ech hydrogenase subunit D